LGDSLIIGEDISYVYPDNTLGFSTTTIKIERGERIALLGPNGSGKSTLMLVLSGLLKPTTGKVLFNGRDISEILDDVRSRIGFVFQDPDVFLFNPTVRDELSYSLRQLNLSMNEIEKRVDEYASVFELKNMLEKPPFRLSGGEKKRVEIASVLIYNPEILFLDEPTSNVDGKTKRTIVKILKGFDGTLIVSTHDLSLADEIAERVVVMGLEKRVVYDGKKSILADSEFLEEVGII